jgi:enamine deaminase RidA (YjgF/YER057c/UK114 family)
MVKRVYQFEHPDEGIANLESIDGVIERFNVVGLPAAVGAYRHVAATRHSNGYLLEISGMLGMDKDGDVIGMQEGEQSALYQTNLIINNIATAITAAAAHYGIGLTREEALARVTSSLVLLQTDMTDFALVNAAYRQSGMPDTARAAFAVKELPLASKGICVEIRANAFVPLYRPNLSEAQLEEAVTGQRWPDPRGP